MLLTIAGNDSKDFPASFLSAPTNLFNHFFKTSSSFGGDVVVPAPKVPLIANTIVEQSTA